MKNAGEAVCPHPALIEKLEAQRLPGYQYKSWFQAIPGNKLKRNEIRAVTGFAHKECLRNVAKKYRVEVQSRTKEKQSLRKLISAVTLFAFAGTLFAQSPFVGTWKLDPAKTKYTKGEPAKDVTLVIEEQGDNLQVTATGTNADGSPLSVKYTVPVKGGAGQVQEGPYDAVSSTMVSAKVRENTYSKGGKEVGSRHVMVSKDGKTMRSTVKGINPQGKPIAGTDVYEKQ